MQQEKMEQLAEELVEIWHSVEVKSSQNPFDSKKRTSLDDKVDELKRLGLCGRKFMLRDSVHGSPIMLNDGEEIKFGNLIFTSMVRNKLSEKQYYRNIEVLQVIS